MEKTKHEETGVDLGLEMKSLPSSLDNVDKRNTPESAPGDFFLCPKNSAASNCESRECCLVESHRNLNFDINGNQSRRSSECTLSQSRDGSGEGLIAQTLPCGIC